MKLLITQKTIVEYIQYWKRLLIVILIERAMHFVLYTFITLAQHPGSYYKKDELFKTEVRKPNVAMANTEANLTQSKG